MDIYGKCGTLSCPRRGGNCYEMLERDYKFYLSFENSLCEDYITEKLWNILQFDVVPIVMGGADYKTLLPPHSYIDVRDFNSSEHLAEYLLMLDQNDDLYRQFFAWKQFYVIRHINIVCQVCAFLNKANNSTQMIVERLDSFYQPSRDCMTAEQYYSGHSARPIYTRTARTMFGYRIAW